VLHPHRHGEHPLLLVSVKRSSRLASKEFQLYKPVEVHAMKSRGLKDALDGCIAVLQKQVRKHGAFSAVTKRAVDALSAMICASSVPSGSDD
jgi:hypothetical protein